MPYIPPEVLEQARQIDLLTYLQSCEPQELVRISGNNYTTRTHDSLKISNGKWMWWSQRIGGYNALDYLVKVKGCSFVEAVETLMGKAAVMPSTTVKPKQKTEPKVLLLPDKSASTDKITEYLFGRGIDYSIIQYCIDKGLIFESLPYHNLVCVGFDEKHKYVSELLGKETIDTNTYGKSSGRSGNYSTNYQISGRELLTPDEVRMLDNRYAILFIRGELPVMDLKYDILKHPAVDLTADGKGGVYQHGKVTSNVATIEVQYLDPDTLPDTEVSETTYELLSDEDFNSETNNNTTKLRR